MSSIHEEAVKLNPDALVALYQLDTTSVGGPVYYFTTEGIAGEKVSFSGIEFTAVPIELTGMSISGQGAIQTPTMTISNTDGLIQSALNSLGDLEGCVMTRWRTFRRYLDQGDTPDGTVFYGPDVYKIDRRSSDTPEAVSWEMSALIDTQGVYVGRTIVRDTCFWRYRDFNPTTGDFDYSKAVCPYAGEKYFNAHNEEVASPAEDVPSRNLGCCRVRFGADAIIPFGGFPGILRGI